MKPHRPGFTLVELLVVITIIGILMSLTLPAINAIRETARQAQCTNHLKQLSTAIMLHVTESNDRYPCGGHCDYVHVNIGDTRLGNSANHENDNDPNNQWGGWAFNVLDYLEQGNLRNLPGEEGFFARLQTPIPFFYCPSRRAPANYIGLDRPTKGDDIVKNCGSLNAKSDYAANAGACGNAQSFRHTDDIKNGGGIIFDFSMVRTQEVTDGTSQTILVGEKYLDAAVYQDNAIRGDDDDCYLGGMDWDTLRCGGGGKFYQDRYGFSDVNPFGSIHLNGVSMIFCDGHLGRMNFNTSAEVVRRLTNRSDGQPVSEFSR